MAIFFCRFLLDFPIHGNSHDYLNAVGVFGERLITISLCSAFEQLRFMKTAILSQVISIVDAYLANYRYRQI